jgi:hypothetical protein
MTSLSQEHGNAVEVVDAVLAEDCMGTAVSKNLTLFLQI